MTYKLSYRDLAEAMAERHIDGAPTTMPRRGQRDVPEFVKRWRRYARSVAMSWRVDEPLIKRKGNRGSLYGGVDKEGQSIDFFSSERRDMAAAKQFLQQAIEKRGILEKITPEWLCRLTRSGRGVTRRESLPS